MSTALEFTASSSSYDLPPVCPICSSPGPFAPVLTAGKNRLLGCPACAVVFLHPRPDQKQLAQLYDEQYYGKNRKKFAGVIESAIVALTRRKWNQLRPLLSSGGRMLDVGCGRGTLVRLARTDGFEAVGLERHFPGTPVSPYIFHQDLQECRFPSGHFQIVVLWHVLEHLSDPVLVLHEIHRVLQPGGWLSLAVPNFGGAQAQASGPAWFHLDLPRHFWHFRAAALETLLQSSGFLIVRRSTFSLEYDWFGTLQSWMNRLAHNDNQFYAILKGSPNSKGRLRQLLQAAGLAAPALASCIWDAGLGRGGTLSILARKPPALAR